MQTLLDYLFSSYILMIIVVTIFSVVITLVIVKFIPKLKSYPVGNRLRFIAIIFIVVALIPTLLLVFLNPVLNYGFVENISDIKIVKNKLCVLDYKEVRSKYGNYIKNRLHIIDPTTGERLHRDYIGADVKFLKLFDNKILFKRKSDFILYDLENMKTEREIDIDYLIDKFPELNIGIEKIYDEFDQIVISAKNGNSYIYNPISDNIKSYSREPARDIKEYRAYYNKIFYFDNGYITNLYELKGIGNNIKEKAYTIPDEKNNQVKMSLDNFIYGEFLDVSKINDVILVKSYVTTDKDRAILTALDFNLRTKWIINSDELVVSDWLSESNAPILSNLIHENKLFFAIGGSVFCVDINNGHILWKAKY